MTAPTKQYGDEKWLGIDAFHAPQDAPPGTAVQADNLFVQAGRWFVRPGMQGQFAAPLSGPLYALTPVVQSDGSVNLWFACLGNLYQTTPGAGTYSQITFPGGTTLTATAALSTVGSAYTVHVASGAGMLALSQVKITDGTHWLIGQITAGAGTTTLTVTSSSQSATSGTIATSGSSVAISLNTTAVVMCQAAGYVYVADASANPLLRFSPDGSTTSEVYTGLAPAGIPAPVTLGNLPLIPNPGMVTWSKNDVAAAVLTTLTSTVSLSSIGTSYTVDVTSGTGLITGATIEVTDGTHWLVGIITAGGGTTTLTVTSYAQSATSGTIATSGSSVTFSVQNLIPLAVQTPTAATVGSGTSVFWETNAISNIYYKSFNDIGGTCVGNSGTGTYLQTSHAIALAPCKNPSAGSSTSGPLYQAYPNVFYVSFLGETDNSQPASRVQVTLSLYSDDAGADLIESKSFFVGLMTATTLLQQVTFDCRDITTPILSVGLQINNANSGITGTNANPLVGNISLQAGGFGFLFPSGLSTSQLDVLQGTVYAAPVGHCCTGDAEAYVVSVPQETAFFTRDQSFWRNLGSVDYSAIETINADLVLNYPIGAGNTVPIRLFIVDTSGNYLVSADTDVASGTVTPVVFDITPGVDAGLTMTAIQYLGVQFGDDIPITTTPASSWPMSGTSQLLTIYDFTQPGNLTPDTSITYEFVEWDSYGDTALVNVIQSNGGGLTVAVTPTDTDAVVSVTLPAKINSASDYWAIYRFGDYPDGFGRLLCLEPWATTTIALGGDTNKPSSGTIIAPKNPYISLSGGVLVDNTPASWLINATTYIDGRIQPPAYIREIVTWSSRIWLLAGEGRQSNLWGSWLTTVDQNAGLYFSTSVSQTDPNAPIEGFYAYVGTQDNDIALRLLPMANQMAILMARKPPYLLMGTDPTNLSLQPFVMGEGDSVGLVAARAATTTGTQLNDRSVYIQPAASVLFLTPNGLLAWDGIRAPRRLSMNVRDLITPQMSGLTAYNPAALAQAACWQHGDRFFLSMPTVPADTEPTCIWRYEEAENAYGAVGGGESNGIWARWPLANGTSPLSVTGGTMIPGSNDNAQHYVAGMDGMLYLFVPSEGDTVTSGASQVGINFTFQSRAFGYDLPFTVKTPSWIDIDCEYESAEPNMALALGVFGRQQTNWSQSYTLQESNIYSAAGNNIDHVSVRPGFARGETLTVSLSGSATTFFAFGPVRLTAATGSDRRRR